MSACISNRRKCGFSLLEMVIVLSIIMIFSAIAVPRMINEASDLSLRFAASDLSGLLQTARIQAVRKNAYYSVRYGTLTSEVNGFFVDLPGSGAWASGDPILPVSSSVTVHQGSGSGAPNEGSFISSLAFTINPGADWPSFNARGLPCIAGTYSCPQAAGQGFVIFMSKPTVTGAVPWTAVVIDPSGHMILYTCDSSGNWTLRN